MKKMLMTFAAVLCCIMAVSAQDAQKDRNKVYGITLGHVEYTHRGETPSATETAGQMLMGSSTSDASVEAPKYEGDVKNAIVKGLSSAYRYRFNDASKESGLIADVLIANITLKPDTRTWDTDLDHLQGDHRNDNHLQGCQDGSSGGQSHLQRTGDGGDVRRSRRCHW